MELAKNVARDRIVASLIAEAKASGHGLATSLSPIVDEIELALSIHNGELEDARRLREMAKLREHAARQHAIRVGKLLMKAKAKVPHGQFQEWVGKTFNNHNDATDYMRMARRA